MREASETYEGMEVLTDVVAMVVRCVDGLSEEVVVGVLLYHYSVSL